MRADGTAYDQDVYGTRLNSGLGRTRSNSYDSSPSHGAELGPLAHMPSPDPDHIDGLHKHTHPTNTSPVTSPPSQPIQRLPRRMYPRIPIARQCERRRPRGLYSSTPTPPLRLSQPCTRPIRQRLLIARPPHPQSAWRLQPTSLFMIRSPPPSTTDVASRQHGVD